MEISKPLSRRIRGYYRRRKSVEYQCEKAITKSCDRYHAWADEQKSLGNKPLTILAEGDSWFRYVVGKAVVFQLERLMNIKIQNIASPGDEVSQMLSPRQLERLVKLLKQGPAKGWKYDCLHFSGGGNDLVGKDRFHKWLNEYQTGMSALELINQTTLHAEFALIRSSYEELIKLRDKHSPKTHLFFHGYDFAIPNGEGVCWLGPWMQPGLSFRRIPKTKRRDVVRLFLSQFAQLLDSIAEQHNRVVIVPTQGILTDTDWANELHPTNSGFKKIARAFQHEIELIAPDSV